MWLDDDFGQWLNVFTYKPYIDSNIYSEQWPPEVAIINLPPTTSLEDPLKAKFSCSDVKKRHFSHLITKNTKTIINYYSHLLCIQILKMILNGKLNTKYFRSSRNFPIRFQYFYPELSYKTRTSVDFV